MSNSRDELRKRFDSKRSEQEMGAQSNQENVPDRGDAGDAYNTGNTDDMDESDDRYDWSDKHNYPFYVPREFAERMDKLYNQYDGKNKIEGGDGLEKHREFLFPIMETALEELDLDEVIEWEATEE